MNWRTSIRLVFQFGVVVGVFQPVFGATTPSDVYGRVQYVVAEVDLIRQEMGVPRLQQSPIAIADAQPREVYFQALTLFEKSNRLLFEQARKRDTPPQTVPPDNINPADVLAIMDAVSAVISKVKLELDISETVSRAKIDGTHSSTDVFQLIVRVNRTLNTLLHQRFSPAEVYRQLTYGVSLTEAILKPVAGKERIGNEPALIRRKTPDDVYRKLIQIYGQLREVMLMSGINCLVIENAEKERSSISPSDVYDMASLLVAELSVLHASTPDAIPAKESYYPGNRLPSHVFQRAGRLESQLETLSQHVKSHPDWLK